MILVLGATGFVGNHVCQLLEDRGLDFVGVSKSTGVNLEDEAETLQAFQQHKPAKVINCASYVGGIAFVRKQPVAVFEKNMRMALNILKASDAVGVKRLVNPISNCAYPAQANLFREEEFWDGPLHETVLVYGFARKASWVGSWAYAQERGLDTINLILSNMYGPGDHFDEERSHALGALIQKFYHAKQNNRDTVTVWGTGSPVREWLYARDGAEALVRGLDCAATIDPVNVGVASGVSIADLAVLIKDEIGFEGDIEFDTSKPDGAPYKTVEGSKGAKLLGWKPETTLENGIRETVRWYIENGVG